MKHVVPGPGRRVPADPHAAATLDNFQLAQRATHHDGHVYLRLHDGKILRGTLRGATPTHIVLVGAQVPITQVEGPAREHT